MKLERKKIVGILESVAAISSAVISLVGVFFYLKKQAEQKRLGDITRDEQSIAKKLKDARTDPEREAYAKQLAEIRARR